MNKNTKYFLANLAGAALFMGLIVVAHILAGLLAMLLGG